MDSRPEPWVLVAGGFHDLGGMDRANAALAEYLLSLEHPVHLVGHEIGAELASRRGVTAHRVAKPAGSIFLAEWGLAARGKTVANEVMRMSPRARVVTNGGNCDWPDINWVHSVHHAWPPSDHGAPAWFRAKARVDKAVARRREAAAIRSARVVVANSDRTRRDLMNLLGVPESKVITVYLGSDPCMTPPDAGRRDAAREAFNLSHDRPLAVFVGALGYDNNKGVDTLVAAWTRLCTDPDWDVDLIVAGGGRGVDALKDRISRAGMRDRIKVVGFVERVRDLLDAADVLVSPVRYEAYGLNVHEALCCGVPALVSASAGIADRYPAELSDLILQDPESVDELMARLRAWRGAMQSWKERVAGFGAHLRRWTWSDMAREMVTRVSVPAAEASPN